MKYYMSKIMSARKSCVHRDISVLLFPDEILEEAMSIYNMIDPEFIPRSNNRKKIICHCIHKAFINCGVENPDLNEISQKLGMTRRAVICAASNPPKYKTNKDVDSSCIEPVEMLKTVLDNNLLLNESISTQMIKYLTIMLENRKELYIVNTNTLVALFILLYTQYKGISVSRSDVLGALSVNRSTLTKHKPLVNSALVDIL